jgi:hypothetical protein
MRELDRRRRRRGTLTPANVTLDDGGPQAPAANPLQDGKPGMPTRRRSQLLPTFERVTLNPERFTPEDHPARLPVPQRRLPPGS